MIKRIRDDVYSHIDSDGSELRVERYYDGEKWYFNSEGLCHRLGGPAVEYADGAKEWCQNDKVHRLDGPAVEWADGTKIWYVEGKKVGPMFLVAYWLERGRCCWYDEEANELRFGDD